MYKIAILVQLLSYMYLSSVSWLLHIFSARRLLHFA